MADHIDLVQVTRRVGHFGQALVDAHGFGSPAGTIDEPWTVQFQEKSFRLYLPHFSPTYLAGVSVVFGRAAQELSTCELSEDGVIVLSYLRTAAHVIRAGLDQAGILPVDTMQLSRIQDRTPPVMPFTEIAGLVSAEGAHRLCSAGYATSNRIASNGCRTALSARDIEILRLIADGYRVIDVAAEFHVSERSMERSLRRIRACLGASGTRDAVATAVRSGLI